VQNENNVKIRFATPFAPDIINMLPFVGTEEFYDSLMEEYALYPDLAFTLRLVESKIISVDISS
jgi:hypothetical protein